MAGPRIELEQATVRLGQRTLWSDLDLTVAEGEFLAVLGPNGTGKTTLLRVLLGLVPLAEGSVRINGKSPSRAIRISGMSPNNTRSTGNFRSVPATSSASGWTATTGGCRCAGGP